MSHQTEWQKQLTFSDRLSITSKIIEAYKQEYPDCAPAEANKHAKLEETTARNTASTLPEYHEICAKSIGRLLATIKTASTEDAEQADEPHMNQPDHGTQIGRYINANHWKDGISSDIFQAREPGNGQTVALKVTTPAMMTAPHDSHREARILAYAKSSNVIPLLEAFQKHDRFILVFPFEPYDLGTLLQRVQPTQQAQMSILSNLFTGLAHIHSLGIIHRDIKPSNILLRTPLGPAYIADFGTAWSSTDTASEAADAKHLEVGTTSYRPPELLFGKQDYGSQLDMWAAGCVAAQVLGLRSRTMFDSGDLGSELALIKSIFETLGTPDTDTWPEAKSLPDWGKMRFTVYPAKPWEEILPIVRDEERDLVSKLVVYESRNRLTAEQALQHTYFS